MVSIAKQLNERGKSLLTFLEEQELKFGVIYNFLLHKCKLKNQTV